MEATTMMEMELAGTDLSQDFAKGIHELRLGLVICSADLFNDIARGADNDSVIRSARAFVDYFKTCLLNAPSVFSLPIDPSTFRHNSEDEYCENDLRVFSKWVYRVSGAFLLIARLTFLHSEVYDLMTPLFLSLKHNHTQILIESIQTLVEMLMSVLNKANEPGGYLKVSFKHEQARRSVKLRIPVASIPPNYILSLLKILLPHLNVIKRQNFLLVPLLQSVHFILQQPTVCDDDKMEIALTFCMPLYTRFQQAQTSWCRIIILTIKNGLTDARHQESLKVFLNTICAHEVSSSQERNLFLVEFESCLLKVILEPVDQSQQNFLAYVVDVHNRIKRFMMANSIDTHEILRKENSIELACRIFHHLPVVLPIFSEVIHKEMFRLLNIGNLMGTLNSSELQIRTPVWNVIKQNWVTSVYECEQMLRTTMDNQEMNKSMAVKTLLERTTAFFRLASAVLLHEESLKPSRVPSSGSVLEFIFQDNLDEMIGKVLQIQTQVPTLLDGDLSKYLRWLFVLAREFGPYAKERLDSLVTQLIYHITFPSFPTVHLALTSDELAQHCKLYGLDSIEECLDTLGSDFFVPFREETSICNVINLAMESNGFECIRGLLRLIGGVKLICRGIDKARLLDYVGRLLSSDIWTQNEEIAVLLAKAVSRIGCLLSKAPAGKNGFCDVCDTGGSFNKEDSENCKVKQLEEWAILLVQSGSSAVQFEILDSMVYLKRHGLIPNGSIIAGFLEVIREPIQFNLLVKVLTNSVPFLTIDHPEQETSKNASDMFHMIFVHLRNSLKTATVSKSKTTFDSLLDLLEALERISAGIRNDLLGIEVAQTTILVLTLSWSSWIVSKCRLIFRSLAESRQLKTCEYMGQIRQYMVPAFVEMCLFQIFGQANCEPSSENDATNCRKCEGLLRATEHAMEFRREHFTTIFFPVILSCTIHLSLTNSAARLLITSIAQFGLLSITRLLEQYFPYYVAAIGISKTSTAPELNQILSFLESFGLSPGVLTEFMRQGLMNELLSYFSVDKDKVMRLLTSILRPGSYLLSLDVSGSESAIRTYFAEGEGLMGYVVYADCKLESTYENVETKRRVFRSFVDVMEFLGPLISGMKMRIAKLLNSCTKKEYLQDLVVLGWMTFTKSLDDSALPSMMNEILATVVHLKSLPNTNSQGLLEEIANYMISHKNRVTRDLRHQVYYIHAHIEGRSTRSVLMNTKLTGLNFLDFLIESLKNGNSYIRQQSILAIGQIVKYEDTTVDLKELLEDSQFVHPTICRLILGLLGCMQSKDKESKNSAMLIMGNLGAVDYYRMNVKNSDRQSRRDGATIFPTGVAFAHAYIDMLRKQYQGTELTLPSDLEICAYAVQEVLRIYLVRAGQQNSENFIWSKLPSETKSLFTSLITAKYVLKDVVPAEKYFSPLYGSEQGKTFQAWCQNFVVEMYTFVTSQPAKEIFRVTLPLVLRCLPVALYLLPYVTLFASLDGTNHQRGIIYRELKKICKLWYTYEDVLETSFSSRSHTPYEDDSHFEEPPANDARLGDRLSVTNAIFTIVDLVSYVSRYGSSNFQILSNIAATGSTGIPRSTSSSPLSPLVGTPLKFQSIKACKSIMPDPLCMARAAFQTQAYQRALLNLEEHMFVFRDVTQQYLPFLQRIFIALEDTDAVVGVSAIRKGKPTIYQETLELLALTKKEEAAAKYQLMMQKGFNDVSEDEESILMQGYFSIEKPEMALTVMNGLIRRRRAETSSRLDDCRIEACWKLQRWGDLRSNLKAVRSDLSSNGTLVHAAILSQFQRKRYSDVLDIIEQAREKCLQSLSTAAADVNIDFYHNRYAEITRLHIYSEIEQSVELMKLSKEGMNSRDAQEYKAKVSALLKNWKDRLDLVQTSLSIVEPIVNTRKTLLQIMRTNTKRNSICKLYESALRDCCLAVAKLEIRAKNYGRALACIQEARQYRSPEVFIQEAKFVALRGDTDRGIRIMNECMKQYFGKLKIDTWMGLEPGTAELEPDQELCAKSLLLLAKFNDEKCNVDMNVNIHNYQQVTEVHKTSEKNFFHLASYIDTIASTQPTGELQSRMQLGVVRYYCKSLEYGSKHVYQSLPRLLFVWLNYAASQPPQSEGTVVREDYLNTVRDMSSCITDLYSAVPAYIFLTAFSQLISRICHPNPVVWALLKAMIAGVVVAHHNQALWMMMAVSKSTFQMRKQRCAEILQAVQAKASQLKAIINDHNILADQLIELCVAQHNGRMTTTDIIAPSLARLLKKPNFSAILMPFQQFLTVTIARVGNRHLKHKTFQHNPVFVQAIERGVEIMPSMQRPKRITLRGSDGRLYGILCKPDDDVRKDSKVMEMNNIVNWYLGKDPEARERNLHVRTYAAVPLNEGTGLLEWVPNLQGLRPVLAKLYKEKQLHIPTDQLSKYYPVENVAEGKMEGFLKLMALHPPVLREWFLTYFSDPQEWYTARSTFTRTCAVMSVVGYLIGLGDRHGENILLDSVSGDVVHVDFSCLFNKGETFNVPEVVPFRLTQNMVNAMGAIGSEGPFRRSCEITVQVLRQNSSVFMSVLTPFVFDPLVEWAKVKPRGANEMARTPKVGEVSNHDAQVNIDAILRRLEGVARNRTKKLDVPLSVEAQVSYLIKEATSPTNLCQMYIGWGAYQ